MEEDNKGWFANVLSQLTKTFEVFIKIFKKNGVIWSLFFLILFVAFWSLIIYPVRIDTIIENRLNHQYIKEKTENQTEKIQAEQRRLEADALITPIMEDVVDKFNLDRILLLELHNNSKNISGIDFLFFSCTYEAINISDYDVEYIGDNLQRQYVNNMFGAEIITMLRHKEYLYYNHLTDYKRNKRLFTKLNKLGCENVMLIPIKNSKQQPLLILCVGNRNEINSNEIYNYIKPFLQQIEQSLITES